MLYVAYYSYHNLKSASKQPHSTVETRLASIYNMEGRNDDHTVQIQNQPDQPLIVIRMGFLVGRWVVRQLTNQTNQKCVPYLIPIYWKVR